MYSYVSDETTVVSTNQPAARRFFLNAARYAVLLDLTSYTQVRLVVHKDGTAANAGATMDVEYATTGPRTLGNYASIGTSAVQVAVDTTNNVLTSGWVNLAVGAQADVYVAVTETGGNGVLDPAYGQVLLQFR